MIEADRLTHRPLIGVTFAAEELTAYTHWPLMFEGIVEAGGVPLAIDCSRPDPSLRSLLARCEGLMFSGGVDVDPRLYNGNSNDPLLGHVNPVRDLNEREAFMIAQEMGIPVLAICRGAQLLNVVLGGKMLMDVARDRPDSLEHAPGEESLIREAHPVSVVPGSLLSELVGCSGYIGVNSEHHQGIASIGAGVVESAHARGGLIEAFEDRRRATLAVQWHPEVFWRADRNSLTLLEGFIRWAARAERQQL